MSESIAPIRPEPLPASLPVERERPSSSFSEALAQSEPAQGGLLGVTLDAARQMARGQRHIDAAVRRARRGGGLPPEELLALQAGVYRNTQQLELASKLVEKATGAIKQTLQSQR